MADSRGTSRPGAPRSTSALAPAGVDDATAVRSRSRKTSANRDAHRTPTLTPGQTPTTSRGASPMPSARLGNSKLLSSGQSSPSNAAFSRGLLEGSWAPSWSSVQDFASSLLEGGYNSEPSRPNSRNGNKSRSRSIWKGLGGGNVKTGKSSNWGPAPPTGSRPAAGDIAAGSLAEREAQLKARKTASVLESYEGVNGGLDVAGKYKRRNSDETPRGTSEPIVEEQLVYLHHVKPTDTYAGIVLRYRCQEQAFRKTNGLWSRDNIQIRKHLMIPVDACETKGRPCDPPTKDSQKVDLLATTPQPNDFTIPASTTSQPQQTLHDSYFESISGKLSGRPTQEDEEQPWTHVRWVKLDANQEPVEIVRVSRKTMGYFPPRRKKSIHTASAFSTPRQSLDLSKTFTNSSEVIHDSPGQLSSRRPSSLSARPTPGSLGASSARSRVTSLGEADGVPAWMRRPGGVGSMSKSVKSPGPAKDVINSWVSKRMPAFSIDSLPSMSVMGSETAHFGFTKATDEPAAAGIVESPFEEGRTATSPARNGMGIEQAAASIESWLRGAWARRPSTPRLGSSNRRPEDLDLIELTDAHSDDGRLGGTPGRAPAESGLLLNHGFQGSTARSEGEGEGFMRGRSAPPGAGKGKKAD